MNNKNVIERRITLRLLAYWEKLRRDKIMPSEEELDPDDLQELWDYCFLIHTKDLSKEDYNYTYIGKELQKAYHGELTKADCLDLSSLNARKLSGNYETVINSKTPLIDEGEFVNMHNDLVKYRECLLPLGCDGKVDAIFGGMRFKLFKR